jgi:hypothetical protein
VATSREGLRSHNARAAAERLAVDSGGAIAGIRRASQGLWARSGPRSIA